MEYDPIPPQINIGSRAQLKNANSPAMKPITAPAHPWTESKAPMLVAAPDPAVGDVVIVAVPDEDVPVTTLSLEVAKILRDLISTREKQESAPG